MDLHVFPSAKQARILTKNAKPVRIAEQLEHLGRCIKTAAQDGKLKTQIVYSKEAFAITNKEIRKALGKGDFNYKLYNTDSIITLEISWRNV